MTDYVKITSDVEEAHITELITAEEAKGAELESIEIIPEDGHKFTRVLLWFSLEDIDLEDLNIKGDDELIKIFLMCYGNPGWLMGSMVSRESLIDEIERLAEEYNLV